MTVKTLAPMLCLLALAACASGGGGDDAASAKRFEQVRRIPTVDVSSRLYTQALERKTAGDCAGAIPGFYELAQRGDGYELAQYHLADCLLRDAEPSLHSTAYLDAVVWMRRAAEAGSPEAQAALALIYLEGPEGLRDPAEAAFWYELARANPAAKRPGARPLDRDKRRRLEAALDPDLRAAARARVKSWRKTVWSAPRPAASPARETNREGLGPMREIGGEDHAHPPGGREPPGISGEWRSFPRSSPKTGR